MGHHTTHALGGVRGALSERLSWDTTQHMPYGGGGGVRGALSERLSWDTTQHMP